MRHLSGRFGIPEAGSIILNGIVQLGNKNEPQAATSRSKLGDAIFLRGCAQKQGYRCGHLRASRRRLAVIRDTDENQPFVTEIAKRITDSSETLETECDIQNQRHDRDSVASDPGR